MDSVSIDFETRSVLDLRKTGVYAYSEHPSTDLWCMAWAVGDGDVELWVPGDGLPEWVHGERLEIRAWNANFERVIWNAVGVQRYGFPSCTREAFVDTAAEAAAMSLPRHLENAARVLGVVEQKDPAGHRLMMQMCKPRSTFRGLVWWDDPERRARLYEYCKQDVRTERDVARCLRRLTPKEQRVYALDQKINDRGVALDLPLIKALGSLVQVGLDRANKDIDSITDGAVGAVTQVEKMKEWLRTQGVEAESLRKSVVRDLLESDAPSIPARSVLELRAETGRSSVAKLRAMLHAKCKDNRVRGTLLYHGANTGRWSAKILQPHNFPRPDVRDVEDLIPYVLAKDYETLDLFAPVLSIASSLLRGCIRAAPGCSLYVGDYAQIECRVLNWFSGEQAVVDLFRAGGRVYERMAGFIFEVPASDISKDDPRRQIGKNTELGCGYGMGAEKFRSTVLEQEGIDLGEELSGTAVRTYRDTHPNVVAGWSSLNQCAMDAVKDPGSVHEYRGARFTRRGGYLWLVLPSGRPLAYAKPSIEMRLVPWHSDGCTKEKCVLHAYRPSVMGWSVDSYTKKWTKRALYGGLLVENIVQALSRDVMAEAMLELEDARFPVVLTVHDEIVAEVPHGAGSLDQFLDVMRRPPVWAEGCPIEVEGSSMQRYRK